MELAINKGEAPSKYSSYWNNIKEFVGLMTHSYRVLPAVTPELEKEAFKLRHKVYCQELQFENNHDKDIEVDQFDKHSTQMVVYSKSDSAYVGCLRIIHGDHSGIHYTLPFEHLCKGKLNYQLINMIKESGDKYAELSRLAIDKEFRHIGRQNANSSKSGKAKSSVVLFSMCLGLKAMAQQQGVRYIFAIVEPRLLNNLRRLSIPAIQIGEGIEHRGLRVPVVVDMSQTGSFVPAIMRPLYKAFCRELSKFIKENAVQMPNIEPVTSNINSHLAPLGHVG